MRRGRPRKDQPKPPFRPTPIPTYYYEWDSYTQSYRWWWNQNPGDVFDLVSKEEIQHRINAARALNIRVVDHLPGFCFSKNEKGEIVPGCDECMQDQR